MKKEHIILRSTKPSTRELFLGPTPVSPLTWGMKSPDSDNVVSVEVDAIDRTDIKALTREADVRAIAPVIPMKLIAPVSSTTDFQTEGDSIGWGHQAVGADTSPFSGDGVVVAVLDTGIDSEHPAFAGVTLVCRDFTTSGAGNCDDVTDNVGHGTHCAGTIFGRMTDGHRIGVAPGIKKALIGKVLDDKGGGSSADIANGIQWAMQNGANVISMSLGIDFPGRVAYWEKAGFPTEFATSRALTDYRLNVQLFEALASLVRVQATFFQPTLIIAAAGNESKRNGTPSFRIDVAPPAVSRGIISVAALERKDGSLTIAPFSNTGVNVSAPGCDIVSAKVGGGLTSMSGTSMATPHVAGVAALWAEKLKNEGRLDVSVWMSHLMGAATVSGLQAGFDPTDIGAGLVRAPQS